VPPEGSEVAPPEDGGEVLKICGSSLTGHYLSMKSVKGAGEIVAGHCRFSGNC